MKATIDIPDDLYRRVKAKSAMQGQPVREVVVTLFQGWIGEAAAEPDAASVVADGRTPAWFGAARKYAVRAAHHDMAAVRRSIVLGRVHKNTEGKRSR
ncbi:MAG: hypothetical protein PHW60_12440 [Kiritimatiellae bacterium]|nr:hypothetical protein [Kiritimatiellia bacterium]